MSIAAPSMPLPLLIKRGPTLLWSYALLAPAMIFIIASLDRSYQTDLWHHLARGREICRTHTLVNRDVFTFTVPGEPIIDDNWLTQIVAYQLFNYGGLELVQTANAVLLGLTLAVLVGMGMRMLTSARLAGLIGVIVVAGLSQTLLVRPQTVSMLLFVLMLAALIEAERRPKFLLYAPALMVIWANVHGAFPIGLVLIGCFFAGSCVDALFQRRPRECVRPMKMLACLLGSSLATLANPYGVAVYRYVQVTSSRAAGRVIQEWLPPSVSSPAGTFWLATIVLMLGLTIAFHRRLRSWMIAVVIVFAAVSCTSVRMSIWWYLAAAPVAMAIWRRRIQTTLAPSLPAVALYLLIVSAMVISLPAMERWNPVFSLRSSHRPEQSIVELARPVLDRAPDARVFSRLEWGEFLSFALPWKQAIFIDGRIEIYSDAVWADYQHITSAAADWQTLLDRYGVTVLMLDRHYHDGLIDRVSHSPLWREIGSSEAGIVYVRAG